MTEPTIINLVTMRDEGDCAVCCLAMVCGVTYAAVLQHCSKRAKATENGLSNYQMRTVAARMGRTLRLKAVPEDDDIGILTLEKTYDAKCQHAVVYVKDTIINPRDGEFWTDLDAFLRDRKWRVESFLRRVS